VLCDDKGVQGVRGDLHALEDLVQGAAPDGVFVFDGDIAVVAGPVERVDDLVPVDLAAAGDAVAPPSDVGGRGACDRFAEDSVAVRARWSIWMSLAWTWPMMPACRACSRASSGSMPSQGRWEGS